MKKYAHKRDGRKVMTVCLVILAALVLGGAGVFSLMHKPATQPVLTYDVVVVGAGPGGIAASLQAARMGAHVALLEPTDWVGGQMTAAGVGTMDEGSTSIRNYGVYQDFVQKATAFYQQHGKAVDTCYYGANSLCVDPQVGQTILRQMLSEESSKLTVYTGTSVQKVLKQGNTVTGVVAGGRQFDSQVVIDADEYGDVIAKAGAAYRLGDGTSSAPDPNACVQDITYTAVMKYYPNGVPTTLQFKQAPPGYSQSLASRFAKFLAQNGYDHFTVERNPMSFLSYIAYRGYPDLKNPNSYNVFQKNGQTITRTSLNLGNDYPSKGNLSTKFLTSASFRTNTICDAKLLTLQLMYYIQHDLGESQWSLANDEGYDTGYNHSDRCANLKGYEAFEDQMPQEPYVREGYRLVGVQTLTGDELKYSWQDKADIPTYSNSIAVGYYPMDVHGCRTSLEKGLDSPSDLKATYAGGPFEVPLGALIPQKVDGLLAAEKNISASRLADGAIREQPIAMDIGQAVGALAALAAEHHTQPRNVSASEVQAVLHTAHVVTSVQ